jgi:hypothetical protein
MRPRRVVTLTFAFWVASLPLLAQTTSGSIAGTVIDAQGAAVPAATVTATNMDQNSAAAVTTDDSGAFLFPHLLPARYTVTVRKVGFRTFEQREIVLNANSQFSLPPITLQVGAVDQSVEVVARGDQLQTETAQRGNTIVGTQLQNVEVNGRSYLALLKTIPGTWTDRDFSANTNELGNIYANGSRGNQQNLTLNGANNTDTGANGRMIVTVSLESVQEMTVLTNSYQAQYGKGAGVQISVVTKSGSRDFHVGGYWYFRDRSMNANSWMNNRDGIRKPYYHYNYVGYFLGGPAYVPGKFNRNKDKLFFFWSDEYQRQLSPQSTYSITVPTALERTGDFSKSVDKNGAAVTIKDYLSNGSPFPGNVIPGDRQYAPGLALLKWLPLPNVTGQKTYNYQSQVSGTIPRHEQLLRLDYNATSNWRIYGSLVNLAKDNVTNDYCPSGYSLCTNFPTGSTITFYHPGYMAQGNVTTTFSPTVVNEAQFDINHHPVTIFPDNPAAWSESSTGIKLPTLYPQYANYIPTFDFGGTRIANTPNMWTCCGSYTPFDSYNSVVEGMDNISIVKGRHFVKAGFLLHRNRKNQSAYSLTEGQYVWGDSSTNPYDSGFGFSNAALGVYSSFTQGSQFVMGQYRFTNLESYLQDTWHITPRITLDYGMRFYHIQPQYDQGLHTANFLPEQWKAKDQPRLYWPTSDSAGAKVGIDYGTGATVNAIYIGRDVPNTGNVANGMVVAGQGYSKYLMQSKAVMPAPRFGIAIDITGRGNLIFRAGGGITYDRYQGNEIFNLIVNPPTITQPTLINRLAASLANSQAYLSPPTLTAIDSNGTWPTVYSFSGGIQARLPKALTIDASYVGSLSRKLLYTLPLNDIAYGADFLPQNQDPTKQKASPTALNGSNAYDANFLRTYPGYGGISLEGFGATSNYNALQVTVNRRFVGGLFLNVAYTWSKCMTTASNDGTNFRIDNLSRFHLYAPCDSDVPQNLIFNYVYPLPKLARSIGFDNRITRALLNDWQISGTTQFRNGTPITPGLSVSGYSSANITGSTSSNENAVVWLVGNPLTGTSSSPYNRINSAAFLPPPVGSIGIDSPRNYIVGPGVNNWDLTAQKTLRLTEKVHAELRADAFNVFNHTQFNGLNATANFASITSTTISNPAYSSSGVLNKGGFGTVSGVRSPRTMQMVFRVIF